MIALNRLIVGIELLSQLQHFMILVGCFDGYMRIWTKIRLQGKNNIHNKWGQACSYLRTAHQGDGLSKLSISVSSIYSAREKIFAIFCRSWQAKLGRIPLLDGWIARYSGKVLSLVCFVIGEESMYLRIPHCYIFEDPQIRIYIAGIEELMQISVYITEKN